MTPIQRLVVLGATGSIGKSTLDVVERHPDRFEVIGLTAQSRIDELSALCIRHRPLFAVVSDEGSAARLRVMLREAAVHTEVLAGSDALERLAALPEVDAVMAAIVGAAGLRPTLAAVRAGKRVLLANKEALVMAGDLFIAEVRRANAILLPIDSEHNAVFQSMPADYAGNLDAKGIRRILLTASGGPFRALPLDQFAHITPAQACAHPKWVMGRKISVDSATMMNKGLEVIEAHYLFNAPADRIEIVIHPQSVIHSMVQYIDGSVIAQLGNPDMRTPIAHALAYPQRIDSGVDPLDLMQIGQLNFERPDAARFPCIGLAYRALRQAGTAPAILNAANEVAVAEFLAERLPFSRIADVIAATLDALPAIAAVDLATVTDADTEARSLATSILRRWQ
jgi:1-deoxy-D-xylulose-5-phosphate reductoisomerase